MPLPRGIQEVRRKNLDGTEIVKFRVQIKRKDFKQDRLFNELDEAIEFLNASKSMTGKIQINLLEKQKQQEFEIIKDYMTAPPLITYIAEYLKVYVKPKYSNLDVNTPEGKMRFRNYTTIKSSFKSIENTIINERSDEQYNLSKLIFINNSGKKPFGSFKPIQITEFEINEYIKARLSNGLKPISIQREISHISNLFKKLKHLDPSLKSILNPTIEYDRDLLRQNGNLVQKKSFRLTDEDKKILFDKLDNYENKELGQIVRLMLLTALRRTEAVLLKFSQINENYIHLHQTKSNRPRIVFLTPEAKELIKSFKKRDDDDRVFTYDVIGFDGSYKKLLSRIGLQKISSHALRKEAISSFIEKIGSQNSLLIAEFLGISSIRRLEEKINNELPLNPTLNTQNDVLKAVGHTNSNITANHYFSLKK